MSGQRPRGPGLLGISCVRPTTLRLFVTTEAFYTLRQDFTTKSKGVAGVVTKITEGLSLARRTRYRLTSRCVAGGNNCCYRRQRNRRKSATSSNGKNYSVPGPLSLLQPHLLLFYRSSRFTLVSSSRPSSERSRTRTAARRRMSWSGRTRTNCNWSHRIVALEMVPSSSPVGHPLKTT